MIQDLLAAMTIGIAVGVLASVSTITWINRRR